MTNIRFIAPAIGDRFLIFPEIGNEDGTITVTDINITPTGFVVEGLPINRNEDDYNLMTREFVRP